MSPLSAPPTPRPPTATPAERIAAAHAFDNLAASNMLWVRTTTNAVRVLVVCGVVATIVSLGSTVMIGRGQAHIEELLITLANRSCR